MYMKIKKKDESVSKKYLKNMKLKQWIKNKQNIQLKSPTNK